MKKLLALALILCLALSLCACGNASKRAGSSRVETDGPTDARTEPAATEPIDTEPIESQSTEPQPEGDLLAPYLGYWRYTDRDGYLYICADWTWALLDSEQFYEYGGDCAAAEAGGLALKRSDGTEEDCLRFGGDGALYNARDVLLERYEFGLPIDADRDVTCYPYEAPDFSDASDLAWEIYQELYPKIANLEDFYYDAATYGYDYMDQMLVAYGMIKDLHPETRNYFMLEEDCDDDGNFLGFRSHYSCRWDPDGSEDKEVIRASMEAFEDRADEIVSGLTDDMTAYEKYYYLASTISANADYDYEDLSGAQEAPWAGVMGGYCVCEGYAEAMAYLCSKADLYCTVVSGVSRNEGHAWNLVMLPGGTYYVDITWADGRGYPGDSEWMTCFMLTQGQIEEDHEIRDGTVATGR